MSKPKVRLDERKLRRAFESGLERIMATDGLEIRCKVCGQGLTLRPESMSCPRCGTGYRTR